MANCLKTQLKSVVQNDNLEKIGEWIIPVVTKSSIGNTDQQYFGLTMNKSANLYVDGGGYVGNSIADLSNKKTSIPLVAGLNYLYFANFDDNNQQLANYKIHIDDKYSVTGVRITGQNAANLAILEPDISKLKFSSLNDVFFMRVNCRCNLSIFEGNVSITRINLNVPSSSVTGNLSSLSGCTSLTSLTITEQSAITGSINSLSTLTLCSVITLDNCTALTGDISALSAFGGLTNIQIQSCSHITGSLSSLANSRNTLNRIYCTGSGITGVIEDAGYIPNLQYLLIRNTSVGGSVEALVEANAARTSGYSGIDARNSNCTFKGDVPTVELYAVYHDNTIDVATDQTGSNVLSTYNKSTGTWS